MRVSIRDAQVLQAVRPLDLAGYLRSKNWQRLSDIKGKAVLWALDGEEILAPISSEFADYGRRIAEAIAILASLEDRSEAEVWRDIVSTGFDMIRLRTTSPDQAQGTISINEGVALVERARELLLSAACAAHEPRAVYHARKPTPAIDYLQRVRLGQTEVGSYVLTMLSPVPPALQQTLPIVQEELQEEPFERRVTSVLMESLVSMNEAARVAASKGVFDPFDEAVQHGVSANLCEAVIELYEAAQAQTLEIGVSWASVRPPREQPALPARVRISRDIVEPLREASRVLRNKQPQRGVEVSGYVVKLAREEGELLGHATLFGQIAGAGPHRRVRVDLPSKAYEDATAAHLNGIAVRFVGELRREGRAYALHGVHDVVFDEDSAEE